MSDVIYTFNGKDITMNVCIQIRAVLDILQENMKIDFIEAVNQFYNSKTYLVLQNTENGFWAESPEYIADRFFEEIERGKTDMNEHLNV